MDRYGFLLGTLLHLFLVIGLNAQPNISWQISLGGSEEEIAHDIEQTQDGGFIVAGYSRSEDGDVSGNNSWKNYWVIKLTSEGAMEWENSYGGSTHDIARDVSQTMDGGYIVAGHSTSEDGDVSGHIGLDDFWVIKLAADGTLEWEQSLGGNDDDYAYAVKETNDGGYVVAGTTASTNGDVTGNHGDHDYWVVKLTSDGSIEWEKALGGSNDDFAYDLDLTSDGGYVIAGKSHSNDGDVTGNQDVGNFVYDYWVVKLTSDGTLEWQKSVGGPDYEVAYSIQQTSDGSYILAGTSYLEGGDVTNSLGDLDFWVVKLTNEGELDWQKVLGGPDDEVAHDIVQTTDGGSVVTGMSRSNWIDVSGNHGGTDYWVVKLSNEGVIEWQQSYGGSGEERAFAIRQTTDEGFVIAGRSNSNNGDVSGNHGENDYWIVRLNACGVNPEIEVDDLTIQSLESAPSSTYQWLDCANGTAIPGEESPSFTPVNSGDYSVIVANGNCIDTSECVTVCLLNNEVSFDSNQIQAAEIAPDVTYQWIDCDTGENLAGEIGQTFEPTSNGNYAVVISDINCTVTSACTTVCPETINTEVAITPNAIQSMADSSIFTFQWINCSDGAFITGETDSEFIPTATGDYAVIIEQGNCRDTTDCVTICLIDTEVSEMNNTLQSFADPSTSTFQWINCDDETPLTGETDFEFTPTFTGDYAVIIEQGNCIDTTDCITVCLINNEVSVLGNSIQSLADTLTSSFLWIDCNDGTSIEGATSSIFMPATTGDFAVVIEQGTCIDTSDCVNVYLVSVDDRVSFRVNVYPNPVKDLLVLEVEPAMMGSLFSVFDPTGKQVLTGTVESAETIIRLTDLPNGGYVLKVESEDGVASLQFVKSN